MAVLNSGCKPPPPPLPPAGPPAVHLQVCTAHEVVKQFASKWRHRKTRQRANWPQSGIYLWDHGLKPPACRVSRNTPTRANWVHLFQELISHASDLEIDWMSFFSYPHLCMFKMLRIKRGFQTCPPNLNPPLFCNPWLCVLGNPLPCTIAFPLGAREIQIRTHCQQFLLLGISCRAYCALCARHVRALRAVDPLPSTDKPCQFITNGRCSIAHRRRLPLPSGGGGNDQ